jgi:hypothetical protein
MRADWRAQMDMTTTDYDRHFAAFNSRYFGGHLPHYSVAVRDRIRARGAEAIDPDGWHDRRERRILLRRSDKASMEMTLLHEMVHAATNDFHGPLWRRELARVRALGAPAEDPTPYTMRLNRKMVAASARDFLDEAGSSDFESFARCFLQEHGAGTVPRALRRFPWLKAVFTEVREEWRSERRP